MKFNSALEQNSPYCYPYEVIQIKNNVGCAILATAADRGVNHPPPPPPFPLLLRDFFLHPLTVHPLPPASSRSSSRRRHRRRLLFLLVFSLSLLLPPPRTLAPLPPYPPRRDDDQTSAITLLLFASPPLLFLVLFRLRSFCSYLPFAKTSTRYRRRGSERSLQLQSGAMHSRGASTRRNVR